jgi:acid phosphatase
MENHGYDQVVGNASSPWVNGLDAAVLVDWHGVAHPSQPNYLALFSGSTQKITNDHCPVRFPGGNLGSQLAAAGLTFTGYSEGLPAAGSTACSANGYVRRHNPWVDAVNLPARVNQPLTALPSDWSKLPTVAFVVPNLCHDTHDCSIAQGDAWLRATFSGYVTWAATHDSLLVITYDEDEDTAANRIPTFLVGPMVVPGESSTRGDHYTLLRTLEALYGLPPLGMAASRTPLAVWRAAAG